MKKILTPMSYVILVTLLISSVTGLLEIEKGQEKCIECHVTNASGYNVEDATVLVVIYDNNTQIQTGAATHYNEGIYCYNTSSNWTKGHYTALCNVTYANGDISSGTVKIEVKDPIVRDITVAILLTITGFTIYFFLLRKFKYVGGIALITLGILLLMAYDYTIVKTLTLIIITLGIITFVNDM